MGNENCGNGQHEMEFKISEPDSSRIKRNLSDYLKSKINARKSSAHAHKSKSKHNNFIINHVRNNTYNDSMIDCDSFDERRLVFVSLIGLMQSWQRVPSVLLYTAVLILPVKTEWITDWDICKHTPKFIQSVTNADTNSEDITTLMELLQWKRAQGLLLCMLDEYKGFDSDSGPMYHPFWEYVRDTFSDLYDPTTGNKYTPINIDPMHWILKKKGTFVSKYGCTIRSVVTELCYLSMTFNAISEILSESNSTLRPIKVYKNISDYPPPSSKESLIMIKTDECESEEGGWVFSQDYLQCNVEFDDNIIPNMSNQGDAVIECIMNSFIVQ